MTHPIKDCKFRRALDTNDWKEIDEIIEYNKSFGIFTFLPCKGHLFGRKKCTFTKDEESIINKHLFSSRPKDSYLDLTKNHSPTKPEVLEKFSKANTSEGAQSLAMQGSPKDINIFLEKLCEEFGGAITLKELIEKMEERKR